jgi:two-component system response regulator FixJ
MSTLGSIRKPTVFVVDDDESTRELFRWLLSTNDISAKTYSCARDFLDSYCVGAPGCLVLDLNMPGMNGLELQQHLVNLGVDIPIIFVTGEGKVPQAVAAVKAGAVDFIEKPFDYRQVLSLVRECLVKDAEYRRTLGERQGITNRLASLTPREREVLDRVVAGKQNRVIAEELAISVKTVEAHRAHLMEKLAVSSVAELVHVALRDR